VDSERLRGTLRRFVKTTISNLGYGDYSEWFIGHVGSEYYTAKEQEAIVIFRKIESYLTFQDIVSLEAKGADQNTQIEQLSDDLKEWSGLDSMNYYTSRGQSRKSRQLLTYPLPLRCIIHYILPLKMIGYRS
jgi:hypothetical protein